MKQEDKELLLRDLCARLPYEVKVTWDYKHSLTVTLYIYCAIVSEDNINNLPKLFLRPMSSMTEEEKEEYEYFVEYNYVEVDEINEYIDWLNSHHFDYRGLIEKGLAIEALKEMY